MTTHPSEIVDVCLSIGIKICVYFALKILSDS